METVKIEYLGDLRTRCTHVKSGMELITDAPTDNQGKGESFSPTDLVATAYGSCMLTLVGIYCQEHHVEFKYAKVGIQKIMESNPRRISELIIELDFSDNNWDEKTRIKVIRAAETCPVAKSVHENIQIKTQFHF